MATVRWREVAEFFASHGASVMILLKPQWVKSKLLKWTLEYVFYVSKLT